MLELVRHPLTEWDTSLPRVPLPAERRLLAKRRWRGVAADGREFGFDLDHPLADGDAVHANDTALYVIAQAAEPVLEIALPADPAAGARLGWMIGNLHFALELAGDSLRVADDPALRQLFDREHIAFTAREAVFRPLSGGHSHHAH